MTSRCGGAECDALLSIAADAAAGGGGGAGGARADPPSLLVPHCGLWAAKWPATDSEPAGAVWKYFTLVRSLLRPSARRVYDLKGSTDGRSAARAELSRAVPLLKDNDLRKGIGGTRPVLAPGPHAAALAAAATRDAEYLCAQNLIDYSLICVVCAAAAAGAPPGTDPWALPLEGGGWACCGIIDYLQPWDTSKMLEFKFKTSFVGGSASPAAISCVPADQYAARFSAFIAEQFPAPE